MKWRVAQSLGGGTVPLRAWGGFCSGFCCTQDGTLPVHSTLRYTPVHSQYIVHWVDAPSHIHSLHSLRPSSQLSPNMKNYHVTTIPPIKITRTWLTSILTTLSILILFTLACHSPSYLLNAILSSPHKPTDPPSKTCEQPSATVPQIRSDLTENYNKIFKQPGPFHDAFRKAAAERLSEAIQINTVSYDFLRNKTPSPDDVPDPSREGILKFHTFLENRFPKT